LKFTSFFALVFVLVLGCIAAPAWADVVAVQNASFETVDSTVGLNINCLIPANCSYNFGPIPGWMLTGQGGSWHPSSAYYNLPLPDGSIVAFSNGGTISQMLAASLTANTTYMLSVDVGHRLDGLVTDYSIALYVGNMLLASLPAGTSNSAITPGTFADETLTFTSGSKVIAGDLRIVLTSTGAQTDFDNVRLTAATPEPSSLSLLAGGLGLLFFVFRRR
jgi:hypothetical protein